MRRLVLWVAVSTSIISLPGSALADEWWGADKALHFTISVGLGSAAYAVAVPFTERREYRVATAAGASLLIGAAKEGYDALGYGDPSWRDFTWDIAGTAVGVLLAYSLDCLISNPSKGSSSVRATQPLTIAF